MHFRYYWQVFVRVVLSLLGGSVLYFVWMAAFLLTQGSKNPFVETTLWVLAPPVTALGFSLGLLVGKRLTRNQGNESLGIFLWPLTGCAIGAGALYWFGPMLIVFGMLTAGTVSVTIHEVILLGKEVSRDRG